MAFTVTRSTLLATDLAFDAISDLSEHTRHVPLTDVEVPEGGLAGRQPPGQGRGLLRVHPDLPQVRHPETALAGEVIDFVELDMPTFTLPTVAAMYTLTPEVLQRSGIDDLRVPGSLHAAEHAAIGLLPLVASCDRGDIGGLSTALGPEGLPTVFVYDGHPGGAGFAERGYRQAATWLGATAAAIKACECPMGCPSCVQSPKCGNGNDPLDKAGAITVLGIVLAALG